MAVFSWGRDGLNVVAEEGARLAEESSVEGEFALLLANQDLDVFTGFWDAEMFLLVPWG